MIIPKQTLSVAIVFQAGTKETHADQTVLKRRKFINVLSGWQTEKWNLYWYL